MPDNRRAHTLLLPRHCGLAPGHPAALRAVEQIWDGARYFDGTWPVRNKHAGNIWFDMEQTGGQSRWNTLRALRVERWPSQARACGVAHHPHELMPARTLHDTAR